MNSDLLVLIPGNILFERVNRDELRRKLTLATMTNPSLNIAWSIAEIEASSAGFESILPTHFWIGCCKACDLDLGKFLQSAPSEVQAMEPQVALDFKAVREALAFGKVKPATLRRALRSGLGKQGDPTARPLHRHPDLRAAFVAGQNLAEMVGGLKRWMTRGKKAHLFVRLFPC
jgi:hypothetical protein